MLLNENNKEKMLVTFLTTIIIFTVIAVTTLTTIYEKKKAMTAERSITERVEDIHSFYNSRYGEVIITAINLKEIQNVRYFKDTTKFGFYAEEEPILTLEIGVPERNMKPFKVLVFKDKIIELHR